MDGLADFDDAVLGGGLSAETEAALKEAGQLRGVEPALAMAALMRARSLAPDHPAVLMMRALAALDRGDRAAAGQTLMRLRGLYAPGSADREALDGALRRLDAGEDPRTAPRDAGVPLEIR